MPTPLGEHLQQLRRQRGLPIARLAAAARLSRNTIARWESGQFAPRLPELHALLEALDASPDHRQRALELLNAPRALRAVAPVPPEGPAALFQPRGGDLLRALRHRRGWSQQRVAECLGVAQSTVARWERSEIWPTAAQLEALCTALGARREEGAALEQGRFPLGSREGAAEVSPAEVRAGLAMLKASHTGPGAAALSDLHYLTLQGWALPHAQRTEAGRALLADIYLAYLADLFAQNRIPEVARYAERAQTLLQHAGTEARMEARLGAAIFRAEAASHPFTPYGGRAALGLLEPWLEVAASPASRAWLHGVYAWSLVGLNYTEEAIAVGRWACSLPGLDADPERYRVSRNNLAGICVSRRHPEEVLRLLMIEEEERPARRVQAMLVACQAYLELEERAEAHRWIVRCRQTMETHGIQVYQHNFTRLEARI